jgi:hypothetical protein
MDHETFVGMVHDLPSDFTLTMAVLHPGNKTTDIASWNIQAESYNPFVFSDDGALQLSNAQHTYPNAFYGIADYMGSRCGASARMLVEYPKGAITVTSAFSQLMAFTIKRGFGCCVVDSDDEETIVRFRETPEGQKPAATNDDTLFLANGKARAYAMILGDVERCTAAQHAVAAALIAMNPHLHYYLKARGLVFSSQDIALFLKDPDKFNPLVIAESGPVYFLSKTALFGSYDPEDLHLEYALAAKRFNFLPSGEALKLAVLSVCKRMGLRLHCMPGQDPTAEKLLNEESLGPNECVSFDPSLPLPGWIGRA